MESNTNNCYIIIVNDVEIICLISDKIIDNLLIIDLKNTYPSAVLILNDDNLFFMTNNAIYEVIYSFSH